MHRRAILLLALALASCDKKDDSVPALKSSSSAARTPRVSREERPRKQDVERDPSAPPFKKHSRGFNTPDAAQHTAAEIQAFRETAAGYARTDPAAGLDWIEKTLPGEDTALDDVYAAFLDALVKEKLDTAIDLGGKVPAGSHARSYSMALYGAVTREDPAKAWALLKENRGALIPMLAARSIVSNQVNRDGLETAYKDYQANRPGNSASFFLSAISSDKGLDREEINTALGLVATLENDPTYGSALGNVVRNVDPADRVTISSWLADRPKDLRYDPAYESATTLMLDSGDPLAAANWASRITTPTTKAATLDAIRGRLNTFDAGTRAKVEELLKK